MEGVGVGVDVLVGVGVGVLVGSVARVMVGVGSGKGLKRTPVTGVWFGAGVKVGGSSLGTAVGTNAKAVDASVGVDTKLLGVEQALTIKIRMPRANSTHRLGRFVRPFSLFL